MLPSQERVTLKLKAGDTVTLAEELATDTTVRYLTLTGNCGDAGAAALGAALKTNNTLRSLVLSSNKIKLKGVIGLAEGLAENRGLMLLDLGNNAIGDAGGVKVAAALAVNKSLISLCVALCELEAESARTLRAGRHFREIVCGERFLPQNGARSASGPGGAPPAPGTRLPPMRSRRLPQRSR